jgi:hypothetical protein
MNIKTFAALILLLNLNNAFAESYEIKNSGIYAVHVKSMPFVKFWNRPKIIRLIAECAQRDRYSIWYAIEHNNPIALTSDKEEIKRFKQLKVELEGLSCELVVDELTFTVDGNDPLAIVAQLSPLMKKFEEAMASVPRSDDDQQNLIAQRETMVRVLQEEIAERSATSA